MSPTSNKVRLKEKVAANSNLSSDCGRVKQSSVKSEISEIDRNKLLEFKLSPRKSVLQNLKIKCRYPIKIMYAAEFERDE